MLPATTELGENPRRRAGQGPTALPPRADTLAPQSSTVGYGAWIGIGGHLAAPPLPHHRAYGSVPRRFDRVKRGQERRGGEDRDRRNTGCAGPVGRPDDPQDRQRGTDSAVG